MSNWGTLIQEVTDRAGGGRGSTADQDAVKQAAISAVARHDSRHLFFNEERATIATVASQATYTTADGLPAGIVRFLSPYLEVDEGQDADNRYRIRRVPIAKLDALRMGVTSTSEPEAWAYFDETLEIYPDPDVVHDLRLKVVVKPGVPIKRLESGVWKFYKPGTTSFVSGNEMDDAYPDPGATPAEANAWFTDPLAYEVIAHYTEYLLWESYWHGTGGQGQKALQRYAEFVAELEDRTAKLTEPRYIEPMDLSCLEANY